MDLRNSSNVTDFFIILTGNSTRQVKAIADYIIEQLKQSGHKIWHIEGYRYALWVLLDCTNVVVHIFTPAVREFYDLERLWGDAPKLTLNRDGAK
ncbi:MAG: ribosome silencing factor [Omnitrophica bacterium]|nr:ribosome silencing factor [Candidatus Omnitrophota bacterium]